MPVILACGNAVSTALGANSQGLIFEEYGPKDHPHSFIVLTMMHGWQFVAREPAVLW